MSKTFRANFVAALPATEKNHDLLKHWTSPVSTWLPIGLHGHPFGPEDEVISKRIHPPHRRLIWLVFWENQFHPLFFIQPQSCCSISRAAAPACCCSSPPPLKTSRQAYGLCRARAILPTVFSWESSSGIWKTRISWINWMFSCAFMWFQKCLTKILANNPDLLKSAWLHVLGKHSSGLQWPDQSGRLLGRGHPPVQPFLINF